MNKLCFTGSFTIFLGLIFFFSHSSAVAQAASSDTSWKIGAKIHFEEEGDSDYIGTGELCLVTRALLRSIFHVESESGDSHAKILLKKGKSGILIEHFTERAQPSRGEEMHATLLYTSPRGFCSSETLKQVCHILFADCWIPPEIEAVSDKYASIIQPSWQFEISEIVMTKSDKGSAFILAKLLFNDREHIYFEGQPVSAGLHMTLVNCMDSSIFSDLDSQNELLESLNKAFQGKFIRIASRNGRADLEFGISGRPWRLRAGERLQLY